jgi:hypothetical protein
MKLRWRRLCPVGGRRTAEGHRRREQRDVRVRRRGRGGGHRITVAAGGGLAGHGLKDLWQHRKHFVANTRWWPPFCMIVDWVVAAIIVREIAAGMHFS